MPLYHSINPIELQDAPGCFSGQPHLKYKESRKIRPPAKSGKAVKIADASNQRKAKGETVSAVAITSDELPQEFSGLL
jgi:hypothetical protein